MKRGRRPAILVQQISQIFIDVILHLNFSPKLSNQSLQLAVARRSDLLFASLILVVSLNTFEELNKR